MTLAQGPGVVGYRFALDAGAAPAQLRTLSALFGFVGGGGLAYAIQDATREAAKFEAGLARVGTLLPPGADALGRYGDAVKDLAVEFGQSTDIVNDALFQTISSSVDAVEAIDFLRNSAGKLAVGGFTELNTAVDGLTNIMNAYGLSTQAATGISDAFFIANRDGKTTVDELARSVGNVAPTAQAAGLSYRDLFSSIAAGTKVGLRTTTVVDSLRTALSALAKPSEEAQKLSGELNLRFDEGAIKAKGFAGFLAEVQSKTGGSTEKLAKLFGSVEAANVMLTLTSKQGLASFNNSLSDMQSGLSLTEDAFTKATNTWEYRSARVREALHRTFVAAGEVVIKEFAGDLGLLEEKALGLEDTVVAVTEKIVGAVRSAAENIESIVTVVLLGRVGAMLRTLGTGLAATASSAAAVAARGAAGAAAGAAAGGATSLGARGVAGAVLGGAGLVLQGLVVASAVMTVADLVINSDKVDFPITPQALEDAKRSALDDKALVGLIGKDLVKQVLDPALVRLWGPDQDSAASYVGGKTGVSLGDISSRAAKEAELLHGGDADLTRAGLALRANPDAFLRMFDFRESTAASEMLRQRENNERLRQAQMLLGPEVRSLEQARELIPWLQQELRSQLPSLIEAATEQTTFSRGYLPGRGHLTGTRDFLNPERLFSEFRSALPNLVTGALQRQETDDARLQTIANVFRDAYRLDIEPFVDRWTANMSPLIDVFKTAVDKFSEGSPVLLELVHKIFDPKKPKRSHAVSLQKRGQAKGLPPRYTALVLREGYGAAVVEPMPEHAVDLGLGRGAF